MPKQRSNCDFSILFVKCSNGLCAIEADNGFDNKGCDRECISIQLLGLTELGDPTGGEHGEMALKRLFSSMLMQFLPLPLLKSLF